MTSEQIELNRRDKEFELESGNSTPRIDESKNYLYLVVPGNVSSFDIMKFEYKFKCKFTSVMPHHFYKGGTGINLTFKKLDL